MASIGSVAVKLYADATAFTSDLDRAARKAEDFGAKVGKLTSAPVGAAANALNAPIKAIDGFVGSINKAVTSIPILGHAMGSAFPASVGGFVETIFQNIEQLAEMGRTARMAGLDVTTMAGLMSLAGSHGDELAHSLVHLNRRLGEVQLSKSAGSDLRSLGLDTTKMQDAATAIQEIFRRWNELNSVQEKSILLERTFGREGETMGAIFRKAGGDWQKLQAAINERGSVARFSADAERGMKRLAEVSRTIQQTWLEIAGYIAQVSEAMLGQGNGPLARVPDWMKAAGIAMGIPQFLFDSKPPVAGRNVEVEAFRQAQQAQQAAAPGLAASAATEEARKLLETVKTGSAALTLSEEQVKLWGLAHAGAAKEVLAAVEAEMRFRDSVKAAQALADEATRIGEEMATPFEKLGDELDRINVLFAEGYLDADIYLRKLQQMQDQAGGFKYGSVPENPAETLGSRAANRDAYQWMMGRAPAGDDAKQTNQKMTDLLKKIDELIRVTKQKSKSATVHIP